jgi:dTDP-4-amino-4,6-dideoxygalactose transaminase
MEKILVTRSSMPPLEEYVEEIRSIWDTHWLTNMGEKHVALEKGLTEYLQVSNISLFTNGHMALELVLQAFELEGEVITTPFTFVSTTHAIVRNGLKPVFCDVDPITYTIDTKKIEDLITEKTCAIVPVHVYGQPCDVEEIEQIAIKYGLKVIYDAAHAFGVKYKGVGVGRFGDASMFSFHATKVYNSIEGGAVCYQKAKIGDKLCRLRNFGILDEETVDAVGANAKMNEFQAAMGLCNLRHVEDEMAKRESVFERYKTYLDQIEGIHTMNIKENVKYNYAYFPVLFDEGVLGFSRDDVDEKLKNQGIYARKYFYPITSNFDCYNQVYSVQETPVAYELSKRILTLPMYADLDLSTVDHICELILEMVRK